MNRLKIILDKKKRICKRCHGKGYYIVYEPVIAEPSILGYFANPFIAQLKKRECEECKGKGYKTKDIEEKQ